MPIKLFDTEISLPELLSIITASLIVLGFYNTYSYYFMFGLVITAYLEVSEIIFSFASFYAAMIYMLAIWAVTFLVSRFINTLTSKTQKLWLHIVISIGTIGLFYLSNVIAPRWIGKGAAIAPLEFVIFIIYLACVSVLILFFSNAPNVRLSTKVFVLFVLTILMIHQSNLAKFESITQDKQSSHFVEFKFQGHVLRSANDFLYIGSTKNYLFMWDAFSKKVIVYPSSQIEWLSSKANESLRKQTSD
jgi:hypothetical protein